MEKVFFTFQDEKSAEEFARCQTPIQGVDVGDGRHVSPEKSLTTHHAPFFKHPKQDIWLVPADIVPKVAESAAVSIDTVELKKPDGIRDV